MKLFDFKQSNILFKTLFFIVLGIALSIKSNSKDLFSSCIESSDFGDNSKSGVIVRPYGEGCFNICQYQCNNITSGLNISSSDGSDSKARANEALEAEQIPNLNRDKVAECMSACMSGNLYSTKLKLKQDDSYIDRTKGPGYTYSDLVSTQAFCTKDPNDRASPDYAYYNSGIVLSPGEQKIRIFPITVDEVTNEVFMCKSEMATIYPVVGAYQNYETQDSCDVMFSSECFNKKDAYKYWLSQSNYYPSGSTHYLSWIDKSKWSARNPYWTDTDIWAKDGDRIVIRYGFPYQTYSKDMRSYRNYKEVNEDGYLFLKNPKSNNDGSSWTSNRFSDVILLNGGDLKVRSINSQDISKDGSSNNCNSVDDDGNKTSDCNVGVKNIDQIEQDQSKIWDSNQAIINDIFARINLQASVSEETNNMMYQTKFPNLKYKTYTFAGDFKNYSKTIQPLYIKHGSSQSDSMNAWSDNNGGYFVQIEKKGCVYNGGDRLQYAFVQAQKNAIVTYGYSSKFRPELINESNWKDVDKNAFANGLWFNVNVPGDNDAEVVLFFRIKALDASEQSAFKPANIPANLVQDFPNDYFKRYNSDGGIAVSVEKEEKESKFSKGLTSIIQYYFKYLYGDDNSTGIVQRVFNNVTQDTKIITMIRAVLILYVTWMSISFFVGIAEVKKSELITIIVKFAVITTLISPNSWDFFGNYMFKLFINGGTELINDISSALYGGSDYMSGRGSDLVSFMKNFDPIVTSIFNSTVWHKVTALFFTNIVGVILFIVMCFALGLCLMTIFKALLVYMISIIMIGVLLMLSPIFFSFMMFKYTSQMFHNWLKQLISFALEPVFVFSGIFSLYGILITTYKLALYYPVCEVCMINLDIIVKTFCVLPHYTTVLSMFNPEEGFVLAPTVNLLPIFGFVLVAFSMNILVSFMSSAASFIVTQNFSAFNAGDAVQSIPSVVADAYNALRAPVDIVKTAFAQDDGSMQVKKGDEQKKQSNEKKKLEKQNKNRVGR